MRKERKRIITSLRSLRKNLATLAVPNLPSSVFGLPSSFKHHLIQSAGFGLQFAQREISRGTEILLSLQKQQHARHTEHPQLSCQLAALGSLYPYQVYLREPLFHQPRHLRPQNSAHPTGVVVKIKHQGRLRDEQGLKFGSLHGDKFGML